MEEDYEMNNECHETGAHDMLAKIIEEIRRIIHYLESKDPYDDNDSERDISIIYNNIRLTISNIISALGSISDEMLIMAGYDGSMINYIMWIRSLNSDNFKEIMVERKVIGCIRKTANSPPYRISVNPFGVTYCEIVHSNGYLVVDTHDICGVPPLIAYNLYPNAENQMFDDYNSIIENVYAHIREIRVSRKSARPMREG